MGIQTRDDETHLYLNHRPFNPKMRGKDDVLPLDTFTWVGRELHLTLPFRSESRRTDWSSLLRKTGGLYRRRSISNLRTRGRVLSTGRSWPHRIYRRVVRLQQETGKDLFPSVRVTSKLGRKMRGPFTTPTSLLKSETLEVTTTYEL